jgi:hypothetical protein
MSIKFSPILILNVDETDITVVQHRTSKLTSMNKKREY